MVDNRWTDPATVAGAEALRRLGLAQVGADRQNPGMYAVYFYEDAFGAAEIRSVGGFESIRAAADATSLILAEAVLEAAAERQADDAS